MLNAIELIRLDKLISETTDLDKKEELLKIRRRYYEPIPRL